MANILLLSAQKPDNTGSGVFLKELAQAFAAQDHAVAVVAGVAADDAYSLPPGIAFYPVRFETAELPFPVVGMSDEMPYTATRYRDLAPAMLAQFYDAFDTTIDKVLAGFAPDIAFSNHLYLLTARVAERHPELPLVGMCHGSELRQFRKNPLERDAICAGVHKLAGVMALHEAQKRDIQELFGLPASSIAVTGTGYNAEVFCCPQERKDSADTSSASAPSPDNRGRTLVFAGKVTQAKGVPSLLHALELLERPSEVSLVIAGGYSSLEEYRGIVGQAKACRAEVSFPGRLSQDELAKAYRSASVFVLPSFYEGLPLVVIEALACGCKVVVSDLPGIRPWLEAEAPEAPVFYVDPPTMRNVDEPEPDALPAFERQLATAIELALADRSAPCDVSHLSWEALAARALAILG